jgi:hypothetical protein
MSFELDQKDPTTKALLAKIISDNTGIFSSFFTCDNGCADQNDEAYQSMLALFKENVENDKQSISISDGKRILVNLLGEYYVQSFPVLPYNFSEKFDELQMGTDNIQLNKLNVGAYLDTIGFKHLPLEAAVALWTKPSVEDDIYYLYLNPSVTNTKDILNKIQDNPTAKYLGQINSFEVVEVTLDNDKYQISFDKDTFEIDKIKNSKIEYSLKDIVITN